MANLTLIDIVQDIANDLDSDDINSIDDTVEAKQIATIVKNTYYELFDNRTWPWSGELFQLLGLGDTTKPTHMELPDNVTSIEWIKYDVRTSTRKEYTTITYLEPWEFVGTVNGRDSTNSTVQTVSDFSGADVLIFNDVRPSFWTTFDDHYIVFDSFDNTVDSTLQNSKTQVYGYTRPVITLSDTFEFTPAILPRKFYSLLLSEATSSASLKLRQTADDKAEQQARRQRFAASQDRLEIAANRDTRPKFGRQVYGTSNKMKLL